MIDPRKNSARSQAAFEEIEHTADWAYLVRGGDLRELLTNAARGISTLLGANPTGQAAAVVQRFELTAGDAESLLVDWLSELAYWAEMEGIIFYRFELEAVTPTHLTAVAWGDRVPGLKKHIKAVTYHNLEIIATEQGLEATIVFDV